MEVFVRDIAFSVTESQIKLEVSRVIHGPGYTEFNGTGLINFNVFLHRPKHIKVARGSRSYKTGCVTFPSEEIGARFLDDCGRKPIKLGGRPILFRKSKYSPRPDILDRIRTIPFSPRGILEEEVAMETELKDFSKVFALQFGWECRDEAFSVEWEARALRTACGAGHEAQFSGDRRELVITLAEETTALDGWSLLAEDTLSSTQTMVGEKPTDSISTRGSKKLTEETPISGGTFVNKMMTKGGGVLGKGSSSRDGEALTEETLPLRDGAFVGEISTRDGGVLDPRQGSSARFGEALYSSDSSVSSPAHSDLELDFDSILDFDIGSSLDFDFYIDPTFGFDDLVSKRESIVISLSQISAAYWSEISDSPVVYLVLHNPPSFISTITRECIWLPEGASEEKFRRSSLSTEGHSWVSPYVSTSLRLVFADCAEFHKFRQHWGFLKLKLKLSHYDVAIERRNLFAFDVLSQLDRWLGQLEWPLAFHVHALITNHAMNPRELLALRSNIESVRDIGGIELLTEIIPLFQVELEKRWYSDVAESHESAEHCLSRVLKEHRTRSGPVFDLPRARDGAEGLFDCFHVAITPTCMLLYGPFPERLNRIMRRYANHGDCFLRVNFIDERNHHLRPDNDHGGTSLIRERVGDVLKEGIKIGGRQFEFLAYSQSALKEHAVWFVTQFWDEESRTSVDAAAIRQDIGHFGNCRHDARLIYCPARYAARLSQAFTSTDNTVSVHADEIAEVPDIKRNESCFTDGVGSVSRELAHQIIQKLRGLKRRGLVEDGSRLPVSAFQIRFQGCKGMVSIDHTLEGRKLVLRPSMTKFDAYNTNDIGIASYFAKPSKLFLNRPLIMLLEGRGVPADVFLKLQRDAVSYVRDAVHSLDASASLLETYGLGTAFRLPSVLKNLMKIDSGLGDHFENDLMKLAIFHVLRELKYRARIPAPGYTLVGVADIHSYLQAGQVFVCVQEPNEERKYLRGPVLITRSPVIHPGDVQVVNAIGSPPLDSPFAIEPLQNTVVFSTLGSRSLPSCLGGGDLDGDVYNVTEYKPLLPHSTYEAAGYEAAKRTELSRPSTINDIADFVVEYIVSDNLGIVAKNWLIFADKKGISADECIALAKLHSDAVDYPKTGTPVPMENIPNARLPYPDWSQPEVVSKEDRKDYYESKKALGILYRDIQLFDLLSHQRTRKQQGRNKKDKPVEDEDWEKEGYYLQKQFKALGMDEDAAYQVVISRARRHLSNQALDESYKTLAGHIFVAFASNLERICASHALSDRYERLSETEAILGVISQRTTQPRRRKELMASLRERTGQLVVDIRYELQMGDQADSRDRLSLAMTAWELSYDKIIAKEFGGRSFWWVCIGAAFEAIRAIEGEEV